VKAILFDQPGGPEVLRLGDAPDPRPAEGELLVRVYATAANRADTLQRRGNYPPPEGASPILGLELAGEVVEGVGDWRPGDRVMAVVTGGGYAEMAVVPAGMAVRIPEQLSFEAAAAIPEAFLTAYLNLFTLGRLQAGETVLIHAGASGIGTAAIQLARAAGAHVFVTAGSDEKLMRCRELGAEVAINYKSDSFRERVIAVTGSKGANLILDFVGAPYWDDNLASLAIDGRLALIGFLGGSRADLDLGPILGKRLHVFGTTLRRTPMPQKIALTEAFAAFALARFEAGELRPVIDVVLPLDQAAEAHRRMESNTTVGKIVLQVAA
jgi:putative PIG3 family NAD(P)H quinone oxidoreductase